MTELLFVIGMHRSGTSVFAGSAMLLGGAKPKHMLGASTHNLKGHFEPHDVVVANENFFASQGRIWNDFRPIALPLGAVYTEAVTHFAGVLQEVFNEAGNKTGLRVLKDPRVSVLTPLWIAAAQQTAITPRFVVMLRHPAASAASVMRRDGVSADAAIALWMRYMLDAERNSRGYGRVIVPVERFLADPVAELESVAQGLGFDWPKAPQDSQAALQAFIDTDLIQNAAQVESKHLALAVAIHETLQQLGQNLKESALMERLDHLRQEFDLLCPRLREEAVLDQMSKALERNWKLHHFTLESQEPTTSTLAIRDTVARQAAEIAQLQREIEAYRLTRYYRKTLLRRLCFKRDGRPKSWLKRLLFNTAAGRPRRALQRVILDQHNRPKRIFDHWPEVQTYPSPKG